MPNSDPASLNVALTFSGLSNDEATIVVNNLPAGSTAAVEVTKPALGGKRFRIAVEGLSVQGARDVATAAFLHVERVANGEAVDYGRVDSRPYVADDMGRAGGDDLAEIQCLDDVHVGCDHDPDRVASAPNPTENE